MSATSSATLPRTDTSAFQTPASPCGLHWSISQIVPSLASILLLPVIVRLAGGSLTPPSPSRSLARQASTRNSPIGTSFQTGVLGRVRMPRGAVSAKAWVTFRDLHVLARGKRFQMLRVAARGIFAPVMQVQAGADRTDEGTVGHSMGAFGGVLDPESSVIPRFLPTGPGPFPALGYRVDPYLGPEAQGKACVEYVHLPQTSGGE